MSDIIRDQMLQEIRKDLKELREQDIPSLRVEIAALKAKNAAWASFLGVLSGGLGSFFASRIFGVH